MKEVRTLLLWHTATALRFELRSTRIIAQGTISRIGTSAAVFEILTDEPYTEAVSHATHRQALRYLIDYLQRNSIILALRDITIVVHRISHGGDLFKRTTVLHHNDVARLHAIAHLSPDGAAAASAVRAAMNQLFQAKHIAVFDTAATAFLPPETAAYALPPVIGRKFHVRRYGYGGILHTAAHEQSQRLKKARRVITVIIDDDVSVNAWRGGTVCETSDGYTPAGGLPGMTRAGAIDPRLPFQLATFLRLDPRQVDRLLNGKSGLASITGKNSYDEIVRGAKKRDPACIAALMLLTHRVAQSIAGMTASFGGVDMIVFSGKGASWLIIEDICTRLAYLGIRLGKRRAGLITVPRSRVSVAVVDANEPDALMNEALRQQNFKTRA